MTLDVAGALARSRIFASLDGATRARLAAAARILRVPTGGHRWQAGEPARELYVIVQGRIKVYVPDPSGNDVVLHIFGPGDSAGEPGLFASGERLASAQAIQPLVCIALGGATVDALVESEPRVLRELLGSLARLAHQQARMMVEAAFYDIPSRVARRLLELADRDGEPADGGGVRIRTPLSQRTLGGMTIASRENVNRALSRFARLGLIRVDDGRITLLDPPRLRGVIDAPRWKTRA